MNYILLILAAILIWTMFWLPRQRAKRAVPSLIKVFRDHNAVGRDNAKTIDELGLKFNIPKGVIGKTFRPPDDRLIALQSLMKTHVVQRTNEGKFYLSEDIAVAHTKGNRSKKERQ